MAQKVNLQLQVVDSTGADVTSDLPFFQDISTQLVLQRVQDFPTDEGPIPNLLLTARIASLSGLETPAKVPTADDFRQGTRKIAPPKTVTAPPVSVSTSETPPVGSLTETFKPTTKKATPAKKAATKKGTKK